MERFEVTLMTEPPSVTHQAKQIKRFGTRLGLGDSDRLKAARTAYYVLLIASRKRPASPLNGPLSIDVTFTFRGPQWAWHVKKPDADNAAKVLVDALELARFIGPDQQVCDLRVRKTLGPLPCVTVIGRQLEALDQQRGGVTSDEDDHAESRRCRDVSPVPGRVGPGGRPAPEQGDADLPQERPLVSGAAAGRGDRGADGT